jgi:DNA adenine methylase
MPTLCRLDTAKRFFYLRKTCYRGMLRYNKKGIFNVPFGRYKTIDFSSLLNPSYSELLQKTHILNVSFEKVFALYNHPKNFMFLDPPYDSIFNNYSGENFIRDQHKVLFDCFSSTKNKCLLVLGKTDFTESLYENYICSEYSTKYPLQLHSSRINKGHANHLIIRNY